MSRENVEIIRSLYAKTEQGDFSFLDREAELRHYWTPDFEGTLERICRMPVSAEAMRA